MSYGLVALGMVVQGPVVQPASCNRPLASPQVTRRLFPLRVRFSRLPPGRRTVTVKEHWLWLPLLSRAVQTTGVVVSGGNALPEAGEQRIVGLASQLSKAPGVKVKMIDEGAVKVRSDGH